MLIIDEINNYNKANNLQLIFYFGACKPHYKLYKFNESICEIERIPLEEVFNKIKLCNDEDSK